MFGNQDGSESYNRFLQLIGDKVTLCGFNNFNAGLDTKTDTTGKYSIFNIWNNYEIMYHVSTLLPHSTFETQQVQKKETYWK